ncbi:MULTISPECIES: dihydroxyacetone kinase family protein [Brucella]|jgi:dihydroxyacetone kinase|uniref:Dak1 domain protein n=1 Tax=Brucella lupini TaxID=255457 RepID=A0A256GJQ7_9HYPH|nr:MULTISPECIES: dihydroxyacetone kinase family protein [Brucella/Ochrobactrum group]QOD65148.1 dihydroxyacetone kinase family protein [Ochrobactrum sp. MT180101]RNL47467.1 dihydroxyacetone kinase family protein [Ochrobactrum sp. MH181795]KAB2700555.1 dihydroxyacetone kinase family protein [Brucella lupini]KAB2724814.1 dihydroxyacetone kinase family protein [Brucella anthropi]KAB2742737.1 dihydroxyacetone kinase family protein [Brucella anthropi]
MTTIFDAPEEFASTALAGFASIYNRYVRHVRGGVVRSTKVPQGKVAVVVGGGSGHYPAFAGYVGPGLADAAVAGDVFASPSTAAVARVCRQAHKGGGILLGFGNYAGDVLNFGVAAERLRAEGIDVRIVPVTDDVASAPADMHEKRRGIAGDLVVFKIAGAAAEAGLSLDEVERLSRHANANTVSFGVAFKGCTLPGAPHPLFTVPEGQMALGLGIHGEPGIKEEAILPASGLASLLVEKLLAECPKGTQKVGVILNGLGATKYEELFVLWTAIASLLEKAGLDTVAPEAGEFVTSLDMQGCSLTLLWLDDELERYWTAACDTPVLRRGEAIAVEPANNVIANEDAAPDFAKADEAGRAGGVCIQGILHAVADVLVEAEEELGRIDAFAGDGDHGQGMRRGSAAAKDAADQAVKAGAGTASVLAVAGDAWADRAGGTSGALWGLLLRSWSAELSDNGNIDDGAVVRGGRRALDAVTTLGRAKPGDKTLVDAFVPFMETLENAFASGKPLADAWKQAAEVAKVAAEATAPLTPKLGRARPLAEKSIGHPDAGAISLALVAEIVGKKLKS